MFLFSLQLREYCTWGLLPRLVAKLCIEEFEELRLLGARIVRLANLLDGL